MGKVDFPILCKKNSIMDLSEGNLSVERIIDFIAEGGLEATFRYNDQDHKFVLANNPVEHYPDIECEWFLERGFDEAEEKYKTSSGFYYGYRRDLWLSPDKIFVSREEAERFEKLGPLNGDATACLTEKPLHTKERQSAHRVIAILAGNAEFDLKQSAKTAEAIEHEAGRLGLQVRKSTIITLLKGAKTELDKAQE
ncbi:MAG: hypothetical protein JRG71_04655 [Deltaproteobacteria bacterium]|nr:hypothetical protein [Deltaproteobacteria bacterium]